MTTATAAKYPAGFLVTGAERNTGTLTEASAAPGPTTGPIARRSQSSGP